MSIANEIERLFNIKNDLKEVIFNKKVTIPEGTLIDEYYKYVDKIGEDTTRDDDEIDDEL